MNNEILILLAVCSIMAVLMGVCFQLRHSCEVQSERVACVVLGIAMGVSSLVLLFSYEAPLEEAAVVNYMDSSYPAHIQMLEVHLERWMDSVAYPDQCRAELHEVVVVGEDADPTGICHDLTQTAAERFVWAMNQ